MELQLEQLCVQQGIRCPWSLLCISKVQPGRQQHGVSRPRGLCLLLEGWLMGCLKRPAFCKVRWCGCYFRSKLWVRRGASAF